MIIRPNRRQFIAATAGASATAVVGASAAWAGPTARQPPNLLLILADDLGWSDTQPYGGEAFTPNLARLASGGQRLTHFYNIGKCYPSRASLLTGQLNHRAGFGGGIALDTGTARGSGPYRGYLAPETPTLAELLSRRGYRSYISGKWHLGEAPEHWPDQRGFDRSFGLISGASSHYELLQERERTRVMARDGIPWTPPDSGFFSTDTYGEMAVEMLRDHERSHSAQPFFLYLAYTAPHFPIHAPREDRARYRGRFAGGWDLLRRERFARLRELGLIDERFAQTPRPSGILGWDTVRDRGVWEQRMETYAAMIERMDRSIGQVLARIQAMGQLDNTLIVFASDNGASHEDVSGRNLHRHDSAIGDRGSYESIRAPWAWAANAPFQFHKDTPYEGGIASSAIVHWPGGIASNRVCRERFHFADVVPTMMELAGQDVEGFYGRSMIPALRGEATPPRSLFMAHLAKAAFISEDWKLVRPGSSAPWSLFNLADDPVEAHDLASREPDRVAHMAREWTSIARREGVRGIA